MSVVNMYEMSMAMTNISCPLLKLSKFIKINWVSLRFVSLRLIYMSDLNCPISLPSAIYNFLWVEYHRQFNKYSLFIELSVVYVTYWLIERTACLVANVSSIKGRSKNTGS